MTPSTAAENITPYEKWLNKKPSAHYIKVFGCTAFTHIPELYRSKLEKRARKCMYLGIPFNKKGYRLLDTMENRIIYSRDVVFREHEFPTLEFLELQETTNLLNPLPDRMIVTPQQMRLPTPTEILKRKAKALATTENSSDNKKAKQSTEPTQVSDVSAALLNDPLDVEERHVRLNQTYMLLAIRHIAEPKTYREAMKLPEALQWETAARSEYKSLMENNTWVLTRLPKGRRALQCRWVFVVKYEGDGSIDRYKARLVIKGFLQKYSIDYDEIFSRVIRMEVLRLLLTIAALLDMEIRLSHLFLSLSRLLSLFLPQSE
ncbi:polyprotein [Phytophthora megakarya]|uniref:Polyprotein n=1 Tax=Phytophthora megakarya TaxID=4795 RepID=A0A225VMY3_9STRA|nr:polyprotein [Phytophthora megakarya]